MRSLRTNGLLVLVLALSLTAGTSLAVEIGGHAAGSLDPNSREVCPVLDTCPDPVQGVGGLAFDGTYLWVGDYSGWPRVTKIDPVTCSIVDQLTLAEGNVGGVAWDGEAVWVCYEQAALIQRIDPNTGELLVSFEAPGFGIGDPNASGLTWDGMYLWHADYEFDMLYQLDPADGRVIQSFPSPGGCPGDIGFDMESGLLVVTDCVMQEILLVDPANGQVVRSCDYPTPGHWGLTVADDFVWSGSAFDMNIKLLDVLSGLVAVEDASWTTVKDLFR